MSPMKEKPEGGFGHKELSSLLTLLICLTLILVPVPFWLSHASSASDPDTQKNDIKQIETDLSREKEQFLKYGLKEKDLLGQLSQIERQIAEKRKFLKEVREKIDLAKEELDKRKEKLRHQEQDLGEVEERLGLRLAAFYKHAKRGYVQLLVSSRDLEQLRRSLKYLRVIIGQDQRLMERMATAEEEVQNEISRIQEEVTIIDRMREAERSRLLSMKEQLDEKVLILMRIHKEREFYETAVRELQIAAQELRETLLNLDRKQEGMEVLPTGFAELKGRLPLPFDGRIIKNHKPLGEEKLQTHKGIFIEGPLNSEVKAIYPGRVEFSGWLKGYGQTIIINHGSRFFSISAHLSEREKQEGDMVKEGEVIGLLGQTGSFSGPKLYFELRRAGVNLDPLKWVKVH
jgi:septal ring factor EnvC (AmiA/AmiB activator)